MELESLGREGEEVCVSGEDEREFGRGGCGRVGGG